MSAIFGCPTEEQIEKKLKIVKMGRRDGKNGVPSETATSLTKNEQRIGTYLVNEVVNVAKAKAQDLLNKWHSERSQMQPGQSLERIRLIPDKAKNGLADIDRQAKPDLVDAHLTLLHAKADWNLFREENDLTRGAGYPDSRIMHWVIIFAIVMIETIINGAFFSQGMERGLVGGMIAAFLITLVNVGAALVIGSFCVPLINHIRIGPRFLGWTAVILYVILLLWFCIAIGHYRSLIQINEDAVVAAIEVMKVILSWALLSIGEIYGALLVVISFLIGVFTSWKAYRADDPYPRYGDVDRKLKKREREYRKLKSQHGKEANGFVQQCLEDLFSLQRETESYVREYKKSLHQSERLIVDYNPFCEDVQGVYNACVQAYRKSNINVRPIDPPAYFSDKERIEEERMGKLDTAHYDSDLERLPEAESKIQELPSVFDESKEAIIALQSSLQHRLIDFEEEVAQAAKALYGTGHR